MRLRLFQRGDEAQMARICLLTADHGGDATGQLDDDDIWANLFVLPYVHRHPDLATVIEDDEGKPAGYLVGADDTDAFENWFHDDWWPQFNRRWPKPLNPESQQDGVLVYGYSRQAGAEPFSKTYPAHLHIDLLPVAQGQGWGRKLIENYEDQLRSRGVSGFHLTVDDQNTSAHGFYRALGLQEIPSHTGTLSFGKHLRPAPAHNAGFAV